jgi:hypothetical protein
MCRCCDRPSGAFIAKSIGLCIHFEFVSEHGMKPAKKAADFWIENELRPASERTAGRTDRLGSSSPESSSGQYARGDRDVPMTSSSDEGKSQDLESGRANSTVATLDLESIRSAIKGIRYGEVRVIIQDGVVIQIDRMEKKRLR